MFQELAEGSSGGGWAVGSMIFFLAVYVVVAIRAFRTGEGDLDERARLALDDGDRKV